MVETFTEYQRGMWHTLSKYGVNRYYIDVAKNGRYVIKPAKFGFLFWILWLNDIAKFIYHVLTYHGLLGVEVHFLDQMSIWDWLLMFFHACFECLVLFFKYPMWENLYRQWELQEEIYKKLGKPKIAANKITRTDRTNFLFYGGVCISGTLALAVQFFYTPKYALNTYALLKADTLPLRIIFCIHELLFMCHMYVYQAFIMVLAESFAVSYQHLLEEMNKGLEAILRQPLRRRMKSVQPSGNVGVAKMQAPNLTPGLDPRYISPGTEYTILGLLDDYKKMMISAQFHNQWVGAVMGFPEGINCAQFVSDVFVLIQLMQEPETDYFGVFFYIMDAVLGMMMLFRMLILLARTYPQSEQFIQGLKKYASQNTPLRKELVKTIPALRLVSAKLTGYTVRPQSVPVGFNELIKWYIAAAMWKRPNDPTRRN